MKNYLITAELTISVNTQVKANNPAEAIELARERGVVSLCHQCATGEVDEEWITSGELDGEPSNLTVEE